MFHEFAMLDGYCCRYSRPAVLVDPVDRLLRQGGSLGRR